MSVKKLEELCQAIRQDMVRDDKEDSPIYPLLWRLPQMRHTPEVLIHFSDRAARIAEEGFTVGQPDIAGLGYTKTALYTRKDCRDRPGYNFAFSTRLREDGECDYHDGMNCDDRMYEGSAILFRATGVETSFYDAFRQVIFWGPDADLSAAVVIEQVLRPGQQPWRWIDPDHLWRRTDTMQAGTLDELVQLISTELRSAGEPMPCSCDTSIPALAPSTAGPGQLSDMTQPLRL